MTAKTDWNDPSLAHWYNSMLGFSAPQIAEYMARLDLAPGDSLVDFGCGNGELLFHAAPLVKTALGVDESAVQLEAARKKNAGRPNVSFIEQKFETCRLDGCSFTKGSARKSLHHLTDESKKEFFSRIGGNFLRNARFVIEDAVLDFELRDLSENLTRLDAEAAKFYAPNWQLIREQFMRMMTGEYPASLAAWQTAVSSGGFKIIKHEKRTCFYGILTLEKI
ncbi:MAG: methyltransferase domain-containing protein [Elusimicrobiaceae bacterium]